MVMHLATEFCVRGPFAHILSLNPHKTLIYILPSLLDSPEHHRFLTFSLNQTLAAPF